MLPSEDIPRIELPLPAVEPLSVCVLVIDSVPDLAPILKVALSKVLTENSAVAPVKSRAVPSDFVIFNLS